MIDCTQVLEEDYSNATATNIGRLKVGNLEINGQCYDIFTGENVIGRDDLSDIVIRSASISTKHAVIDVEDWETHFIFDCGSTNKTRLGKVILKPNARYELRERNDIMFANLSAKYTKLEIPQKRIPDIDDSGSETGSESMLNCEPENDAELDFKEISPLKVIPGQGPEVIRNCSGSFNLNESSILEENRKNSSSNSLQVVEASLDDPTDDEDDLFVLPSQTVKEFNSNKPESKLLSNNKSNLNILTKDAFSCSENEVGEVNNSKEIFEMETQEQEDIATSPKNTSMNTLLDSINTQLVFSSQIKRGSKEQNPKNHYKSTCKDLFKDGATHCDSYLLRSKGLYTAKADLNVDEMKEVTCADKNKETENDNVDFFEAETEPNDSAICIQEIGMNADIGKCHLINEAEQNRRQENGKEKESQVIFFEAETQLNDNGICIQEMDKNTDSGKCHLFNAEAEQNHKQKNGKEKQGQVNFFEAETQLNDNGKENQGQVNFFEAETQLNDNGIIVPIQEINKNTDSGKYHLFNAEADQNRTQENEKDKEGQVDLFDVETELNCNILRTEDNEKSKNSKLNVYDNETEKNRHDLLTSNNTIGNDSLNITNCNLKPIKSNYCFQEDLDMSELALSRVADENVGNEISLEDALTQENPNLVKSAHKTICNSRNAVVEQHLESGNNNADVNNFTALKSQDIATHTIKKERLEEFDKQENLQLSLFQGTCKYEKDIDLDIDETHPSLDLHHLFAGNRIENSPNDDFASAETQPYNPQKTSEIENNSDDSMSKVEPSDCDETINVSEFAFVKVEPVDNGISKPSVQKSTSKIISEKELDIRSTCVSQLSDIQSLHSLNTKNQEICNNYMVVSEGTDTKSTITISDMEMCSTIDDNMYISKLSTCESTKKEQAYTESSAKHSPLHSKSLTNSSTSLNCSNNKVDEQIIRKKRKTKNLRSNKLFECNQNINSTNKSMQNTMFTGPCSSSTPLKTIDIGNNFENTHLNLHQYSIQTPTKTVRAGLCDSPILPSSQELLAVADETPEKNQVSQSESIKKNVPLALSKTPRKRKPSKKLGDDFDVLSNDGNKGIKLKHNQEQDIFKQQDKNYQSLRNNIDSIRNITKNTIQDPNNETKLVVDVYKEYKLKNVVVKLKKSKNGSPYLEEKMEYQQSKVSNRSSKHVTEELLDDNILLKQEKDNTEHKIKECINIDSKDMCAISNEDNFINTDTTHLSTKPKNKKLICPPIENKISPFAINEQMLSSKQICVSQTKKTSKELLIPPNEEFKHLSNETLPLALPRTSRRRKPSRKCLDVIDNDDKKSINYLPTEHSSKQKIKNDLGLINNNSNVDNAVSDDNVETSPVSDVEKESKLKDDVLKLDKCATPKSPLKEINKSKQTKKSYKRSKQASNKLSNNEIILNQEEDNKLELKSNEILNVNANDSDTVINENHSLNTCITKALSTKYEDKCSLKVMKLVSDNSDEGRSNSEDQFVTKTRKKNKNKLLTRKKLEQENPDHGTEPLSSNGDFKHLEEKASIVKKTPKPSCSNISQEPINISTSKDVSENVDSIGSSKSWIKITPAINTRSRRKQTGKCSEADLRDDNHISQEISESSPKKSNKISKKDLVSKEKESFIKPIIANDNVDNRPKRNCKTISIKEVSENTNKNAAELGVVLQRSKRGQISVNNLAPDKEVLSNITDSDIKMQESYEQKTPKSKTGRVDLKNEMKLDSNKNDSSKEIQSLSRIKRKLKVGTEPLNESSHLKHLKLCAVNDTTGDTHVIGTSPNAVENKINDNIDLLEDKSTCLQEKKRTRKRLASLQDKEDTLPSETTVNTCDTSSPGRKKINKTHNSLDPFDSVDLGSKETERTNRKMTNDEPVFIIPTKRNSRKKDKTILNQPTLEAGNHVKSPKTPTRNDNMEKQFGKWSRSRSASISSQGSTDSRFGTPRRSPINREHQILFTCLSDPNLVSNIKELGGKVVDCPSSCSVLVTDKVRRTVKFLCCLGQGKPIVTSEWINQSMRCKTGLIPGLNRFKDPMEYLLKDREAEKRFQFKLERSLQEAKRHPLFSGYSVHATPNVKPPPGEIKTIIECCGGVYLDKIPSKWPDQCLVISHPEDTSLWKKFKVKGITPPIVAAEIILLGVLQQKLDVKTHKLL